jgi:membrane protein implicated in regulation of membrane protease activity
MENLKNLFQEPEVIWFIIGLLLLVIELFGLSLIIGFFGIGAWITSLILLGVDVGFSTQLVIFVSSSLLSLITLRKLLKNKFFDGKLTGDSDTQELKDEFIGHRVEVEESIAPNKKGKVSFKGSSWMALSDEHIKKGEMAEIIGVNSIQLTVKSVL